MKTLIVSGKTIEEAIQNGLSQMNVTKDHVTVRVLVKPSHGLFGFIGVRPAKIELTIHSNLTVPPTELITDTLSTEPVYKASAVVDKKKVAITLKDRELDDDQSFVSSKGINPIDEAKQFITEVTRLMGLNVEVTVYKRKGRVTLDINGPDLGLIIGRRGQTLDSLQYLTNLVVNRYSKHYLCIILDAKQFRKRRRKTLESLSERLANKVTRFQQEIVLEPMTAQDRKIIHAQLQDHPKVQTCSKGEEPNRYVVVMPK